MITVEAYILTLSSGGKCLAPEHQRGESTERDSTSWKIKTMTW